MICLSASLLLAATLDSGQDEAMHTAGDWFRRADDLTNLRMSGATPFRMKVTFHAYPGVDLAKKGKSTIITGEGIYEETWLNPETWRREVTFPGYHAVEIRVNGVRKYQADSDYEPSRVLMMLDALWSPVPRSVLSPELIDKTVTWKIEPLTAGPLHYVRVSNINRFSIDLAVQTEFDFLPNGVLVRSEERGLTTGWQGAKVFGGKLVPGHFEVQAMGHDLVAADVAIAAPGTVDPASFELAGPAADPGATLRPFHWYEVRHPDIKRQPGGIIGDALEGTVRGVIDRDGNPRELEIVEAASLVGAEETLNSMRDAQFSSPTIDGNKCEMMEAIIWHHKSH